jgi:hypothetical protein
MLLEDGDGLRKQELDFFEGRKDFVNNPLPLEHKHENALSNFYQKARELEAYHKKHALPGTAKEEEEKLTVVEEAVKNVFQPPYNEWKRISTSSLISSKVQR